MNLSLALKSFFAQVNLHAYTSCQLQVMAMEVIFDLFYPNIATVSILFLGGWASALPLLPELTIGETIVTLKVRQLWGNYDKCILETWVNSMYTWSWRTIEAILGAKYFSILFVLQLDSKVLTRKSSKSFNGSAIRRSLQLCIPIL